MTHEDCYNSVLESRFKPDEGRPLILGSRSGVFSNSAHPPRKPTSTIRDKIRFNSSFLGRIVVSCTMDFWKDDKKAATFPFPLAIAHRTLLLCLSMSLKVPVSDQRGLRFCHQPRPSVLPGFLSCARTLLKLTQQLLQKGILPR